MTSGGIWLPVCDALFGHSLEHIHAMLAYLSAMPVTKR